MNYLLKISQRGAFHVKDETYMALLGTSGSGSPTQGKFVFLSTVQGSQCTSELNKSKRISLLCSLIADVPVFLHRDHLLMCANVTVEVARVWFGSIKTPAQPLYA